MICSDLNSAVEGIYQLSLNLLGSPLHLSSILTDEKMSVEIQSII